MKRVRDSDPERLELSDPTLKRALSSLADDGPSSAELQRMRRRLMGMVEAPPAARGRGRGPSLNLARGPLAALLVGVAVAAVIGWVRSKRDHGAVEPSASTEVREATAAPAPDIREPVRAPAPLAEPAQPVEPALSVRAREPARPAAGTRARHARVAPGHALGGAARQLAAPSGDGPATGSEESARGVSASPAGSSNAVGAEVASIEDSAARESTPAPAHVRAGEPRADAAPKPSTPAPLDEASLLQRARQLAASDPEAALHVLSEHKRRFTHGMLTPEREVLAIELLRALSRGDEAARRVGEFRRNFPDSVYLQRLER